MSNGGISIISGIQPFQPLVGSWRPAPQAMSDGIGIAIISGKRTDTGLSAARAPASQNGLGIAIFFSFLAWTQIQHCQPHAGIVAMCTSSDDGVL